MATQCFAMVRGSAIRVTGLGPVGQVSSPVRYATSKSVAKVQIDEVVTTSSAEVYASEDVDDTPRIGIRGRDDLLRYTVSIDFLRVDPGLLNLVAGVSLAHAYGTGSEVGFGDGGFGQGAFGGGPLGDVAGFDGTTRLPAASFGLEVWSNLGSRCHRETEAGFDELGYDEGPFGGVSPADPVESYGYTLFPFLKGGYLSGFAFDNGLVSFNLRGAQARRASRWAVGPYDLSGAYQRLWEPVEHNTLFRTQIVTTPPPVEANGIKTFPDIIQGGTASTTSSDIVDGETVTTSGWIIEGGRAQ